MDVLKVALGIAIGMLGMQLHNMSIDKAIKAGRRRHADDMTILRDEMRADRRAMKDMAYSAGYAAGKQRNGGDNNG